MNLNNLYDLAEKEHIKIYDYYIEDAYGCFINIDKINAIALNYTNIDNSYIEKETLSEELGIIIKMQHTQLTVLIKS